MIVSAVIYLLFAALLVTAAVIDLRTLRIPNVLIVGLGALWLVWRVALACGGMIAGTDFLTSFLAPDPFKHVSFANGIIGSIALGGGLLVVTAVYEAVSKKRAMGGGDIKLLAVVGLFLGIERGIVCLFVACVCCSRFYGRACSGAIAAWPPKAAIPFCASCRSGRRSLSARQRRCSCSNAARWGCNKSGRRVCANWLAACRRNVTLKRHAPFPIAFRTGWVRLPRILFKRASIRRRFVETRFRLDAFCSSAFSTERVLLECVLGRTQSVQARLLGCVCPDALVRTRLPRGAVAQARFARMRSRLDATPPKCILPRGAFVQTRFV